MSGTAWAGGGGRRRPASASSAADARCRRCHWPRPRPEPWSFANVHAEASAAVYDEWHVEQLEVEKLIDEACRSGAVADGRHRTKLRDLGVDVESKLAATYFVMTDHQEYQAG